MYLKKSTSLTFDILRLIAALFVAFFHCFQIWFSTNNKLFNVFSELAHFAVIIFFVLSGYLIGYTTTNNNRGIKKYMIARFSRLYSVLIPVLIITFVIEKLMGFIASSVIINLSREMSILRYIISGLFLNEIWFFSAAPPINSPLWSLSFEFWFYMIFGFWFFRKKNKVLFTVLLIAAILISGPKILSMFPIWLFGMLAFKLPKPEIKKSKIPLIIITAISAIIILFKMDALPYEIGHKPLFFAGQFLKDWVLGFFIGFVFWLLPLTNKPQKSKVGIKKFRKISDLTYTIYLMHLPFLYLFKSLITYEKGNSLQFFIVFSLVIISSMGIGVLLENKRDFWTKLFKNLFYKKKELKFFNNKF